MTFANLSLPVVLAGLAGLALALFLLQQLRTRYREVTVVTTLFWKQVVDEAPVRKLRERFRHPWAYALILAIASLLWVALAEPRFDRGDDGTFHVLVLDGSAGMGAGNRFAQAVGALEREVARLPRARRQVLWSGAEVRPLLNPGEHELLLTKRLERLAPEPAPASLERLLRQLSATPGDTQTSVVVFGDAPVRKQVLDLVPASVKVSRAASPAPLNGNAGITALGVSDAASGAWDKVDVFIDLQATADRAAAAQGDLQIALDGQPVPNLPVSRFATDAGHGVVVQDLPAAGGLLTVTIAGTDNLALDNAASIRLPHKPLVKVLLSPSLVPVIGPVLDADRGVAITRENADVVIRRAGETVGSDLPALEFVRASTQPQAFLFTHPASADASAVLTHAVADVGLRQIDAMSLAQATGRPIEVSIVQGRQWRFSVWEDLLSEDFDFTRTRAFPLFVASAVRWLGGSKVWYSSVAAGRPLLTAVAGERPPILSANGRVLDPLGADFVPASAGELKQDGGLKPLSVSLLDTAVTTGTRDASLEVASLARVNLAPGTGAATWLLLLAAALLAYEWRLFQRGRIP